MYEFRYAKGTRNRSNLSKGLPTDREVFAVRTDGGDRAQSTTKFAVYAGLG
jgi:hypothetical protein